MSSETSVNMCAKQLEADLTQELSFDVDKLITATESLYETARSVVSKLSDKLDSLREIKRIRDDDIKNKKKRKQTDSVIDDSAAVLSTIDEEADEEAGVTEDQEHMIKQFMLFRQNNALDRIHQEINEAYSCFGDDEVAGLLKQAQLDTVFQLLRRYKQL